LITGVTGFVGSYLAEFLLNKGYDVYGTIRWRSRMENIEHIKDKLILMEADIRDAHSMEELIREVKPGFIYHLAAQSYVPASFTAPIDVMETNLHGTINILEAVRKFSPQTRMLTAGSSEEYGLVYPDEIPIKESNELRPQSPYAVSKVGQDKISLMYARAYDLKVMVSRAFNHEGVRRGDVFVTQVIAKQAAEIKKGKRKYFTLGNLAAKRDFSDVRDIIRGYHLIVTKGKPGEVYNLGSGKAISIKELVNMISEIAGIPNKVVNDPSRMRPADVPILLCDYSKIKRELGWVPRIPFSQTIKEMYEWWMGKI